MSELKRTQLYSVHVAAGAEMVDFGGWEMPMQYPSGIIAEHQYTRYACSQYHVSHMGRIDVEGPDQVAFLQHVLSSNVLALDLNQAQYCIIPDENGSAVDDAYLYRFEEDRFLLVVNAANTEKDLAHLHQYIGGYYCRITNITGDWASIAVQGPKSKELLTVLAGGAAITEPVKNALNTLTLEGHEVHVAKTGYTGEPLGYEVYIRSDEAVWLWNQLVELGARPAGLGARDTLRLEAGFPLYGHEMGTDPAGEPMPIFAVPLARFAVSFSEQKGSYVGRGPLEWQYAAYKRIMNRDFSDLTVLPKRIMPITLLDRGVLRAFHFYAENQRAADEAQALRDGDFNRFLELVRASGRSSAQYLQNVVPTGQTEHQELMVTIALSERILAGRGAVRVHGGGFGGTAQAFVPLDLLEEFRTRTEEVLGAGSCHVLSIRPVGGTRIA